MLEAMLAASARSGSRSRNARASNSSRNRSRGRRKGGRERSLWSILIPLALGVGAGLVAMHYATVLTLLGSHAFMLLYPWVVFFEGHPIGISYQNAMAIGQMLVYLQFPAYGLLAGLVLLFSRRIGRTLLVVLGAHGVGLLLALLAGFLHRV